MNEAARLVPGPKHHAVRFYENEKSLACIVAEFLRDGLVAGDPGIVIATPAQRAAIVRELAARSLDIVRLQRSGDLMLLDAEDILSTFMVNGKPDGEGFKRRMYEVIKSASRGRENPTVRIYGQMVDILWKARKQRAAIRLEVFWNHLAKTRAFSLVCGYAMGNFYKDANLDDICRHHTHVISADGRRLPLPERRVQV